MSIPDDMNPLAFYYFDGLPSGYTEIPYATATRTITWFQQLNTKTLYFDGLIGYSQKAG